MRCLYCGKELALLKRWTGGGEFCSDAHRQRYQEEYNQLALNRLLQGNALAESGAPGAAKSQTETGPDARLDTKPEALPSVQPATPEITPAPKRLGPAPMAPAASQIRQEPTPSVMVADEPPPQAAVVEAVQPSPM